MVQIFYYPVVGHDIKLVVRKQHREKTVEFFPARAFRMGLAPVQPHLYSGCTAVMAVSYVGTGNFTEQFFQPGQSVRVPNAPYSVGNSIGGNKIIKGRLVLNIFYDFTDFLLCPVYQKNGAGVGVRGVYMADTVKFFVLSGIFMLFYDPILIIIHRRTCHKAGL